MIVAKFDVVWSAPERGVLRGAGGGREGRQGLMVERAPKN